MRLHLGASVLLVHLALAAAKSQPQAYVEEALRIIDVLRSGSLKGQAWDRLALFTDTIGNRISGSDNLQRAVDYMLKALKDDGLENVHGEEAVVPHWVRGRESATMLEPRHNYSMRILGLGTSVGTSSEGLTAEVVVVSSFDELDAVAQTGAVKGKVVLYNPQCDWGKKPIGCYPETAQYRAQGASRAAKYGAVASFVRSLASDSIGSPHTGQQHYEAGVKRIPAAAITVEDADAMARMQARGQKMVVRLYMEGQNLPDEVSHNMVAEWRGRERPEEVVIVSGHLDSWDVGVGAMDDGGGAAIAWQAISTLRHLNMRPKRTVRVVLWTCEEFGGIGAQQYYDAHKHEASNVSLVIESDLGVFKPRGMFFSGNDTANGVMKDIMSLMAPINASTFTVGGGSGYETDTGPWQASGVPGASLDSENSAYFHYHHSDGDQMKVLDPDNMDLAAAVFAVVAYVVADLDNGLSSVSVNHPVASAKQGLLRSSRGR